MANALTSTGINGGNLQSVQTVPGSVTSGGGANDSPFTVDSITALMTDEIKADGFVIYSTEPIHLRFDGALATAANIVAPKECWMHFPNISGGKLSALALSTTATVYIEAQKEIDVT